MLAVSGKPYEMGYQHGTKCQRSICVLLDKLKVLLHLYFPNVTENMLVGLATKFIPYAQSLTPHLVEEMQGIADGAKVKFEEIFALNSMMETCYSASELVRGCTAFAVLNELTQGSGMIVGETQDWWVPFAEHYMAMEIRPIHGPNIMMTTLPGMVGLVGRNSDGIFTLANGLTASDHQYGLPDILLGRVILEQRSLSDALDILVKTRRAVGSNYILGDKHGRVHDIELTARDHEIIDPKDGFLVHTNRYLSPKLKDKDAGKNAANSTRRLERMTEIINARRGRMNLIRAAEALSDHDNRPDSICRHPDNSIPESRWNENWKTAGAVLMSPENLGFYVACGNPCEKQFERYS